MATVLLVRIFLKNWLGRCSSRGETTVYNRWHPNFIQFEAASRQGCLLCRLFMRDIKQDQLQTARKIETRLQNLGKLCFLTIKTNFTDNEKQFLKISFPGLPHYPIQPCLALIHAVPKHFSGSCAILRWLLI